MMTDIQRFLHQQWLELKKDKYSMALLLVVLLIATGMGVQKGRVWYIARKEGAAQIDFADAYSEYQTALRASLKNEDAGKREQAFKDADVSLQSVQDMQGGSLYSIYAQALQADVLVHEKQYDKALDLLGKAIVRMGVSSPAYDLYKTKQALLFFDAGQASKGITLLEELVADKNNKHADTAAFYLGSYYWSQKQFDKAKAAWKMLENLKHPKDPQKDSPWLQLVAAKLEQL